MAQYSESKEGKLQGCPKGVSNGSLTGQGLLKPIRGCSNEF